MKETEIGERLVPWLRGLDWDVYQEVPCNGPKCDIVAKRGAVLLACELKVRFGLEVICQAEGWVGKANYVYVAVPEAHRGSLLVRFADSLGIGVLQVSEPDSTGRGVREIWPGRFLRRTEDRLLKCLRAEQRDYVPAGSASGAGWTPWKSTCAEVQRVAKAYPGLTLRELVDKVRHHYATPSLARAAIVRWIDRGIIPGVEIRREGKAVHVWPKRKDPPCLEPQPPK